MLEGKHCANLMGIASEMVRNYICCDLLFRCWVEKVYGGKDAVVTLCVSVLCRREEHLLLKVIRLVLQEEQVGVLSSLPFVFLARGRLSGVSDTVLDKHSAMPVDCVVSRFGGS